MISDINFTYTVTPLDTMSLNAAEEKPEEEEEKSEDEVEIEFQNPSISDEKKFEKEQKFLQNQKMRIVVLALTIGENKGAKIKNSFFQGEKNLS